MLLAPVTLAEEFLGDFDVLKVVGAIGTEDGFLMAFAKDENKVAWLGLVKSELDGLFAVEFLEKVAAEDFAFLLGASNEAGGDSLWVFVTRVVLGNDDNIGIMGEDAAANGAGGRVAATGATVDRNDFALMTCYGGKNLLKGVWGMSVIDNNSERLTFIDEVHATFDRGERGNAVFDLGFSEAEFIANSGGSQGIINVKFAGNVSRDSKVFVRDYIMV